MPQLSLSVLLTSSCQDSIDTLKRGLITSGFKDIRVAEVQDDLMELLSSGTTFDIAVIHIGADFETDLQRLYAIRESAPGAECVVVSSSNDADLAKTCFEGGAVDYITMPFTKDTFASRLKKATIYKIPINGRPRILILEDDPVSGRLMQNYLNPFGECTLVVDGMEAVRVFEQALTNGGIYHLLVLDIMVPGIHGKDVLKRVREIEVQHGVPMVRKSRIIMTTALSDTANVVDSFKGKCDSYLVKPIDRKVLNRELAELGFGTVVAEPG